MTHEGEQIMTSFSFLGEPFTFMLYYVLVLSFHNLLLKAWRRLRRWDSKSIRHKSLRVLPEATVLPRYKWNLIALLTWIKRQMLKYDAQFREATWAKLWCVILDYTINKTEYILGFIARSLVLLHWKNSGPLHIPGPDQDFDFGVDEKRTRTWEVCGRRLDVSSGKKK